MFTLPNGTEISDEDLFIWEAYDFSCVICEKQAVCLHEEPPKSLNPSWKTMPETRFPVCNEHHQEMHRYGRGYAQYLLDRGREENFPNALRRINEWKSKRLDTGVDTKSEEPS